MKTCAARFFGLSLALVSGSAILGCDPVWRQRIVVVAAHPPKTVPKPIAGATVRIECPQDVAPGYLPPSGSQALTDKNGEAAFSYVGFGVSSACFVAVEGQGYVSQRFRVADVCLETDQANAPYLCPASVVFAVLVLDGPWNDNDSHAVAGELSAVCLADLAWAGNSRPTLQLDRLINKTDEHLDVNSMADAMLATTTGAKKFRLLDMNRHGEPGVDADYHLSLEIRSVLSTPREGVRSRAYTVTATVIRAADSEIVCQATAQRKKEQLSSTANW